MSYELGVKNESGFTLIELLIAMVIGLIVLGSIFASFTSQKKAYALQEQITEMEQNLRAAMDSITRDMRNAGYNPAQTLVTGTSVGIVPDDPNDLNDAIVPIGAGSIKILSDLDDNGVIDKSEDLNCNGLLDIGEDLNGNGILDNSDEKVTYSLNGATLCRNSPVSENITGLTFRYYDAGGAEITTLPITVPDLSNIRVVEVSITARTSKEDPNFTPGDPNSAAGVNINGTPEDGLCRTRTLTARVRIRNIGLHS